MSLILVLRPCRRQYLQVHVTTRSISLNFPRATTRPLWRVWQVLGGEYQLPPPQSLLLAGMEVLGGLRPVIGRLVSVSIPVHIDYSWTRSSHRPCVAHSPTILFWNHPALHQSGRPHVHPRWPLDSPAADGADLSLSCPDPVTLRPFLYLLYYSVLTVPGVSSLGFGTRRLHVLLSSHTRQEK